MIDRKDLKIQQRLYFQEKQLSIRLSSPINNPLYPVEPIIKQFLLAQAIPELVQVFLGAFIDPNDIVGSYEGLGVWHWPFVVPLNYQPKEYARQLFDLYNLFQRIQPAGYNDVWFCRVSANYVEKLTIQESQLGMLKYYNS